MQDWNRVLRTRLRGLNIGMVIMLWWNCQSLDEKRTPDFTVTQSDHDKLVREMSNFIILIMRSVTLLFQRIGRRGAHFMS
jgi:hypothetical protein